ncbi:MAG: ATP-binding cassette domain-containing protein [Opitutales bacterium]
MDAVVDNTKAEDVLARDSAPLIRVRDMKKSFGEKSVLDGVDIDVYEKQIVTVIGKSGTGKSVFLKCLSGIMTPDAGSVEFRGSPISWDKNRNSSKDFRKRMSYMFQNSALFDSLSVYENIALPLKEHKIGSRRDQHKKVVRLLHVLDIDNIRNNYPGEISGGMQRRVALARALITEPEIVLFDEPTTGLDPVRRNAVFSLIADTQKKVGFTAIIVSHDIPEVFYISDHIALIDEGKAILSEPSHIIERSDNPVLRSFLDSHETLQNELSGLLEPLLFEQRYTMRRLEEPAHFWLFRIEAFDDVTEVLGHVAAQHLFQHVAEGVSSCLESWEYASRCGRNELGAISVRDNEADSEKLIHAFEAKLKEIPEISGGSRVRDRCVDFSITISRVPLSGETNLPFRATLALARKQLKPFVQLSCSDTRPPWSY